MADQDRRPNVIRVLVDLQQDETAKHQQVEEQGLDPGLALLRNWQAQRLAGTYADLLADPEYAAASRFFLSDIYAARDFSQRDHDFERLYHLLSRFLPAQSLHLLRRSLDLNHLSYELDRRLLGALVDELGVRDALTPELYTQGYRLCDHYDERAFQIREIVAVIEEVGAGARLPLVGVSLRLARVPAHAAGWMELYDFLERGYRAFRPLKSVEKFARTIGQREMDLLERIYGGESNPF